MTRTEMMLGNTYRLTVLFKTYAGVLTNCDGAVSFKIYNSDEVQVGATATATNSATGTYYYDYTPDTKGLYYWTVSGVMSGKTAMDGGEIVVVFV